MVELAVMPFRIKFGELFKNKYYHLEKVEKERIDAFVEQLKVDPMMVGKPLRYKFFGEKKFNGKRLYFLVYEEWNIVLFVRLSGKKDKSEAIEWVLQNLPELRHTVEK